MSADQYTTGDKDRCLLCDGTDGELHAPSFAMDHTVRQYAIKLKDTNLLRKIAACDLVAIDAQYHKFCMTKLLHDTRTLQKQTSHHLIE